MPFITLDLLSIIQCNTREDKALSSFGVISVLYLIQLLCLSGAGGGGEGTTYHGLYGEAPPERGTFFKPQVCERVGSSLVIYING